MPRRVMFPARWAPGVKSVQGALLSVICELQIDGTGASNPPMVTRRAR